MSIARPRLMCSGWTRVGLPSVTSYDAFISGSVLSALTRAQPTRWVNEILPPRARRRWLLMTIRLSQSSLTGTWRTLVAVGTVRLASMFCTVRAGAPRRTVNVGSSEASAAFGSTGSLGTGFDEAAGADDFAAGADDFAAGAAAGAGFWPLVLAGCGEAACDEAGAAFGSASGAVSAAGGAGLVAVACAVAAAAGFSAAASAG